MVVTLVSEIFLKNLEFTVPCLYLGDITQKGYEKKKAKLLMPYINSERPVGMKHRFCSYFYAYLCSRALCKCNVIHS